MAIKVKAGNPEGVHDNIPGGSSRAVVKEFDESEERSKPTIHKVGEMGADFFTKHPTTREPGHARELVSDYSDNVKVGWYESTERDGPNYIGKEHSPGFGNSKQSKLTIPQEIERTNTFVDQMEEGFSSEETNQVNPFEFPAAVSTKSKTLSESIQEVALRFKLLMVAVWLPKDYRVLPPLNPMPDKLLVDLSVELKALALKLWESYEPQLGAYNTVTVLQMEAPPEEEEDGR